MLSTRVPKGFCPFGCRNADPELGLESEFDDHGYCKHTAGFLNLKPGQRAVGHMFEPLEAIPYPIRDADGKPIHDIKIREIDEPVTDAAGKPILGTDGKPKTEKRTVRIKVPREIHSGLLRVNGRKRQVVLDTDVVITPERIQKEQTWVERTANNGTTTEVTHTPKLSPVAWVFRKDHEAPIVLKVNDDDPAAEIAGRIEDKYAELAELESKAKEIDLRRESAAADEEQEAEQVTAAEKQRMRETVTA